MPRFDKAFARIEQCTVDRLRCPQNDEIPGITFSTLARQGRIKVMVFRKNYRVVEILVGPHAGKQTADAPDRRIGEVPYKIVDASAPSLRNTIEKKHRQEPWKPGSPRP